ncbi:MAG: hypothetical protein U5K31_14035 [Balneolaceae bacterium]|nr:hypothetical protein [Balneolaceae bacterium]
MELVQQQGIPGDLDEYICGFIDRTLSQDQLMILSGYLDKNPEAGAYFEKAVKASRLLRGLPDRDASPVLEHRLALSLSEEKVRRLSG